MPLLDWVRRIFAMLLFSATPQNDRSSQRVSPLFSSDTALRWALGLLVAALCLELYVSQSWTQPLQDPGTWVLLGVLLGLGFRALGRRRAARGASGAALLRWMSIGTWGLSVIAGLLGWFL